MISMSMVREYINGSVYHCLDIRSIVRPHKGANIFFVIQRDLYMIGNTKGLSYTCKGISNGHNVIGEKFLLLMQFFTK